MQTPALCTPAGSQPNRWETLCALQSLLPLLKKTAGELGRDDIVYWFEQAEAEAANIIRGRPSDSTAIPALIVHSPRTDIHA
ncbi:MAG: hypothetical protein J0I79_30880 [Mesorhizobium sp.]|uniref:hypothetical protein n=1 Tax=Mesorhizobium sp. TaxID=1871066 RepID=UPI001AD37F65|nr:hypothetical protein [Mesorhizobium sp.]MBN9222364.1 hypothetical protein [Mesorhizobium sp.]